MAEAEKAVGGAREVVDLLDGAEARAQRDLRPQLAQGEDLRHEAGLSHEAEGGLFERSLDFVRLGVDIDAERLEDIADRDAELRAHALLAVHDDRHAGGRDDERRCRAHDDALLAPVIRAADIEQAFDLRRDRPRRRPNGLCEADQLLRRLAFVALDEQEAARLGGRRLPRKD